MKYICVCLILLVSLTVVPASAAALDIVATRGSIMVDGISIPVFEKSGDVLHAPASLTKVMTALLAVELGDLEDMVNVSSRAVASGGSSLYLTAGSTLSLKDLLYATLLISGNDAAAAIAEHLGGSIEGFADLMNKKAKELGMNNTNFTNPHGMPDSLQFSTANDMALLALAAARSNTFIEIASTPRYRMQEGRVLVNQNKLLESYNGLVFGKTGYTHAAGQCFVAVAEIRGLRVATVIMGSQGVNIWSDTEALLDYGFGAYQHATYVLNRQTLGTTHVPFVGEVLLVSTRELSLVSPSGHRPKVEIEVYAYPGIIPPLRPGDIVAEALVRVGDVATVIPLTIAYHIPLFTSNLTRGLSVGLALLVMYGVFRIRRS